MIIPLLPAAISVDSSWDHIHKTLAQINSVMLDPDFDIPLFSENKTASMLTRITIFEDKTVYIDNINKFLIWYYLNLKE